MVLLGSLWAAMALIFDVPQPWLGKSLAGVYSLVNAAALFFMLPFRRVGRRDFLAAFSTYFLSFGVVLFWWLSLRPSHDRQWIADVAKTPWAEFAGDFITIHNVRDFVYRTESDFDSVYTTRTVRLSDVEGIDFSICYWGSEWIAHPIVSFRFKDDDPISLSVETRKEVGETYSALRGFFRQFELIYVVAEERDIIRLRTNFRQGEDVYLYGSKSSPERSRAVFLDYMRRINKLHAMPEFYNALTSNCTTNIRIHTSAADGENVAPWDWRILLNGKIDEMGYERGTIDQSVSFEELKRRSHINAAALAVEDLSKFSTEIRSGLPGF